VTHMMIPPPTLQVAGDVATPVARADLTMIDVSGLLVGTGALPPEPLHHLLYANGTAVRHVMTDGRLQVFEGGLVAGEAAVLDAGGRAVQKVWQQLDREGWFR